MQRGQLDQAGRVLSDVAEDSEYFAAAQRMEVWRRIDAGESDSGVALAQALSGGGDLRSLRTLADVYRTLERYGEAEPLYSQLLETSAEDWRLSFARAIARERLGRIEEAEADLQRALGLSPDQPDVLNYLGYLWVDWGVRLQEGLAMIERAALLKPDSGAIVDSLGWAHYRLGAYDRALDYLERAVLLAPADPTLNDHLGDLYWRLQRRVEARFQWRRALSLAPENAAEIERKLREGLPEAAAEGIDPQASAWWRAFDDPVLDRLIDMAAQRNLDLRLAQARIREARALARGRARRPRQRALRGAHERHRRRRVRLDRSGAAGGNLRPGHGRRPKRTRVRYGNAERARVRARLRLICVFFGTET